MRNNLIIVFILKKIWKGGIFDLPLNLFLKTIGISVKFNLDKNNVFVTSIKKE
jgi:hypothetical protein